MRIVFYSASTSAHSNSSTKTTYQPFRADTWDEMDRLYPDCEFVVAGPLNGSYIFDVADGEICKKPEKVKYVLLESGMSAEDTAELIAQQRPDIAVAIASGAVPFDWVPIKTGLIAEELNKKADAMLEKYTKIADETFDSVLFRLLIAALGSMERRCILMIRFSSKSSRSASSLSVSSGDVICKYDTHPKVCPIRK